MKNRIDLIRNAVNNLNSKSEFKTKLTSKNKLPRTSKAYKNFLKSEMTINNNLAKLDVNHNVWKDSESFAKTHYSDVYNETTKIDNEWN
ncbi:MAG: hypothetical protein HOK52_14945 [Candidatus Marinimicrobia bacterium]|jgi:hypothetical protein|nr:hypothetical protein [Candidatus Neomarinimicrobiota bacterium]